MGESIKATLGGLIFLSVMGAGIVWFGKDIPLTRIVWVLRLLFPLIIISSAMLLIWAMQRSDIAPDLLRQLLGKPFERDGLCFSIVPTAQNGICYLNIVFQNQYEQPCRGRVVIRPQAKSFTVGKRPFDGVAIDIQCDGGAFGLARAPMELPRDYQGKLVHLEVAAATHYPNGRGTLLRFRNGVRAGKADASDLASAAVTVSLLAVGVIRFTKPATVTLTFPGGVAESKPTDSQPIIETLWKPGDATERVAEKLQQALNMPA